MSKTYIILFLVNINGLSSLACTGFYVNRDGKIYAGNNEDYINPKTKMWILPGDNDTYGKILFGFDDYYPQGGINEKGLFFDGFATEYMPVTKSANKPKYESIYDALPNEILSTCSNVEEVISLLSKYNLDFLERAMFFFGDAYGNSIIVEGDSILRKIGDFQVITNFYQSKAKKIFCKRFKNASDMLSSGKNISVDYCKEILNSTHAEGQTSTLYSQVYDIENMIIYIYNFHNYEESIIVDIKEELKKGLTYYDLPDLFTETSEYEKFYEQYMVELNNETAQRQMVKPKLNTDYNGKYLFQSVEAQGKTYKTDLNHYITIDIENEKLIYIQRYGCYFRCELLPESKNSFFYKINYGEFRISFPNNNGEKLICEAILRNNIKFVWTCIKKE